MASEPLTAARWLEHWSDLKAARGKPQSMIEGFRLCIDSLDSAEERIRDLEAALRPFADAAKEFDVLGWPKERPEHPNIHINVWARELKAARALLQTPAAPTTEDSQ